MLKRRFVVLRLVLTLQLVFPPSKGGASAVEEANPALLKSQTRLYDKLARSVGARPDEVGPLKEALSQSLKETDEKTKSLIRSKAEFLLSEGSLSPEIFIRFKERLTFSPTPLTPDHPSFKRLQGICEDLRTLAEDSRIKSSPLASSLQRLQSLYEKYIQTFCSVVFEQRIPLLSSISIRENVFKTPLSVSEEMTYHLLSLDKFGVVTKTNVLGSSAVTRVEEIYVKKNLIKRKQGPDGTNEEQAQKALEGTLDPGMEGAVSLFHEIFFGRGMVSSCLLCLPHVQHLEPREGTEVVPLIKELKDSHVGGPRKEAIRDRLAGERGLQLQFETIFKPYVCQVTEGVEGEMLGDFLGRALKEPSLFKKLDMPQVQKMILSQMLTRPADAKGDNLMVTQSEKGFQIVGIDNDLSFCSPLVQLAPHYHALEMRSLLFVLPALMDEPLLPEVRASFLELSPLLKTLEWLYALEIQNQGYESLIAQEALPLEEAALLKLPFKVKQGEALRITRAMNALQTQAKAYPDSTLMEMLKAVSPLEALYYEKVVAQQKDPLKAFDAIYKQSASLEDVLGQEAIQGAYPLEGLYKQRDQTVEGAIHELLDKIEIRSIAPVTPLLEGVFKHAPSYFKNPQTVSPLWKESRLLWRALGERAPLSVVQSLLNLISDSAYPDPRTLQNVLHYGALNKVSPKVLSALAEALSLEDRSRMLNSEDREGKTPLDHAFIADHPSGVMALIELGAWGCAADIALKFYKSAVRSEAKSPLGKAFLKLMRLNQAVEWEVSLEEMLPSIEGKKAPQATVLTSAAHGKRLLSQGVKDQILSPNGELKRGASSGNHTVAYAQGKGALKTHGLYFKAYPALPGLEEAAGSLTRQLLGKGAPYAELARIGDIPFLLSQEIPGDTLLQVLKKTPEILGKLDSEDTIGLILAAMLINPEDGKPDNYIVTPHPIKEGVYRLVGVDNDQAFVPAIVREKPQKAAFSARPVPVAQVKTVLYCLNQMLEPVPNALRTKMINMAPDQFLDKWLSHLRWVHSQYTTDSLFTDFEQKAYFKQKECFLGVPFQKGALSHLYGKMVYLRDLLFQYPSITPLELLSKLEPRLAKRYAEALKPGLSVEERFRQVDQPFYEVRKDGSHTTMTKSGAILQSMNIPLKESILETVRNAQEFGPRQAIKELKEIKKTKAEAALQSLAVRAGDQNFLKRLNLEETRAEFLKELARQDTVLAPQEQTALLNYLSRQRDARELILPRFTLLDDKWMEKLPLEHLRVLDVRQCVKLSASTLVLLSQKALGLEELNLGSLPQLKTIGRGVFNASLSFAALKVLSFTECKNLTRIEIEAPLLTYLNVEGCSQLTDEGLDSLVSATPLLKTVKLEGVSLVTEKDRREKRPAFPFSLLRIIKKGKNRETIEKILKHDRADLKLEEDSLDISERGLFLFARAIELTPSIKALYLWGNQVGNQGAQALAQNTTLTMLYLGNNKIGYQGAKSLAQNTTLTTLNLWNNQVGDQGVQALAQNTTLTTLNLWNNNVGDQGAQSLALNTTLTKLDLQRNQVGYLGAQALAQNTTLKELNLYNNQVGDQGAQALAQNTTLTTLSLSSNQVGYQGAQALAQNTTLTTLSLSSNQVGYRGAQSLSLNTILTTLDLSDNQVGDQGAQSLAQNTTLATLNLWKNQVGDQGAKALAQNTTLTTLSLSSNQVGYQGAQALAQNTNLATLNLFSNQVGDQGAQALAQNTNLATLNLRSNQVGDQGAKSLALNTTLATLDLSSNQVGGKGAQALAQNTTLATLNLRSNQVGGKGAQSLAQNTILTTLDLSSNQVGDKGAQSLAQNTILTTLDLSSNQVGDKGAQALAKNITLTSLWLGSNQVGEIGKKALRESPNSHLRKVLN